MNHFPGNMSAGSGEAFEQKLHELVGDQYRTVDIQFNLARGVDGETRGLDVVSPTRGRLLITPPSCQESEDRVRRAGGDHSMLNVIEHGDDYSLYHVPQGARLLARTLQNPPYEAPYMRLLATKADRLLGLLDRLDQNSFGLSANNIAIGHNGDENDDGDDTFLMVVPPLDAPSTTEQGDVESLYTTEDKKVDLGRVAVDNIINKPLPEVGRYEIWNWLNERHKK